MLNLRVRIEDDFTGVVIDQPFPSSVLTADNQAESAASSGVKAHPGS